MLKIILSAGHGEGKAHNRGGVCYNEGDNNFNYSLVLKKELETYRNVVVDLIRKKISDNPSISARAKMGAGYDLYLSLHSNGFSDPKVRGTEVFDSVEKPNRQLAKLICDGTAELFNHPNRGVKYREGQPNYNYYGELRFNQAKSSMIVESGFHTNSLDCNFFKNNHVGIAKVQARAIASHYGLVKKTVAEPIKDIDNLYRVQVGAFKEIGNANKLEKELNEKGYETITLIKGGLYKVQVGAYSVLDNAEKMEKRLKKDGFNSYIERVSSSNVNEKPKTAPKKDLKVGSKVMVKNGAKDYNNKGLADFVYKTIYDVIQINGDRVVIGKGKTITAAVNKKDIILK